MYIKIGLGVFYGLVYNSFLEMYSLQVFILKTFIRNTGFQTVSSSVQTTDHILPKFAPNMFTVSKYMQEKLF